MISLADILISHSSLINVSIIIITLTLLLHTTNILSIISLPSAEQFNIIPPHCNNEMCAC